MTLEVSPAEKMIVLAALYDRYNKLAGFIDECNAKPVDQRQFPTDKPETWRQQMQAVVALLERLSLAGGGK